MDSDSKKDKYVSTRIDEGFYEIAETTMIQKEFPIKNLKLVLELSAFEKIEEWQQIMKIPDEKLREKKLAEFEDSLVKRARKMMRLGFLGEEQYGWKYKKP